MILFLLFSISVLAEGSSVGKIKGYALNTGGVYISMDSVITSKPTCNITDRFFFSLSEPHANHFLSVILSAKATDETLIVTGTGDCAGGNSEVLRKICTINVPC